MMGLITNEVMGQYNAKERFSVLYMPLDTGNIEEHTYAGYFFVAYAFALL